MNEPRHLSAVDESGRFASRLALLDALSASMGVSPRRRRPRVDGYIERSPAATDPTYELLLRTSA